MKQLLILSITVFLSATSFGQLTLAELNEALNNFACIEIAPQLDTTPLLSEEMKFIGAICFYKNGEKERALELFREVRQLEAKRSGMATYWEAKCHASVGADSLAMACLQAIPTNFLNQRMLASEEFENLSQSNRSFTRLKHSVAPGFNIWTGLLAVTAVLGLLIGLVLFFGKTNFPEGERRLSVAMLAAAFILFSYLTIWTNYSADYPYLMHVWQPLTLLIGPSLYFYLKDVFKEDYTFREAAWHYTVPVVAFLFSLPTILSSFGLTLQAPSDLFTIATSPALLTGHLLFYSVLIHQMTNNEWQVDANIKLWTKVVSWGMVTYSVAFLSYFILVNTTFFNPEWDYAISLVMALGILAIGYMGLVQKRVFQSEPISHFLPIKKYQSSSLTDGASASIKKGMERLLKEEQVFKENELRLADLAAYLDVSYHQLSQVINEHYGVNFFELINRYRVAHVKKLLADPKHDHYTIIQIAYEAGFNNKASFNRYFKKEIGMTPSAYRIKERIEIGN